KNPTLKFEVVVHFNLASARDGLGQCELAAKRYQKTARYAVKRFPQVEALSLLRLSYAYECLGLTSRAAVTLVDVYNRRKYLPKEVALAEVPARLAGSYAQLGNQKLADKYFKVAERGLGQLRNTRDTALARRELLAKTLFLMGKMKTDSIEKVGALKFMESMEYLQKYLLKSVEMGSVEWSVRAGNHLVDVYKDLWTQLNRDPFAGEKKDQQNRDKLIQQVKIAQKAYFNLTKLKESRFPGDMDEPKVIDFFKDIDVQESKFQMFIASNVVGSELTPEAKKLDSLKREGRGVGKSTVLEKENVKKSRLPEKKKGPGL
ncbi:MAG: hypothetical protein KDD61_06925, partial [Bdellovibrionales bacterium]|nr:hypothetical protein [Bdellovibrionales bacterium]